MSSSRDALDLQALDILEEIPKLTSAESPNHRPGGEKDDPLDLHASKARIQYVGAADDARIRKKIDRHVMPAIFVIYFLLLLDKHSLSMSSVFGLSRQTNLTGSDYSMLGSIVYIAELVLQPLVAYCLVRVRMAILVPALMILWGTTMACMAAAKNFMGLLVARFFLGVFEAPISPAFILIIQMWYRRHEQGIRIALYYSNAGWVNIFGSLMMFGLGHVQSRVMFPYQIVFILLGGLTLLVGICSIFFFPDNPTRCKFLSTQDKVVAIERLRANQQGAKTHTFKPSQVLEMFLDPKSWLWMLMLLATAIPGAGIGTFGPLILKGFGFDNYDVMLLSMPLGALQLIVMFVSFWANRKYNIKSPMIIMGLVSSIIAAAIMLCTNRSKASQPILLFSFYLFATNVAVTAAIINWASSNVAGHTKSSATIAFMSTGLYGGSIVGPLLFQTKDRPYYRPGVLSLLCCNIAALVLVLITLFYLRRINDENKRRRIRNGKAAEIVDYSMMSAQVAEDVRVREVHFSNEKLAPAPGGQSFDDLTDLQNDEFITRSTVIPKEDFAMLEPRSRTMDPPITRYIMACPLLLLRSVFGALSTDSSDMELIDFDRYTWHSDGEIPGRVHREPAGGESVAALFNRTKHGEQNLFLGVYTTSTVPLTETSLVEHAKSAWTSLRWEVPTIAATTSHIWSPEGLPTSFITYDVAKSAADVAKWAYQSVKICPDYASKTLDDLRYDLGQSPVPAKDFDMQTILYLVPFSPTQVGILIHTSHVPFDGSGVKILMTKFLSHFVKYIADPGYLASQQAIFEWGTEDANLLPCVTDILRKREPAVFDDDGTAIQKGHAEEFREGKEYFETLSDVMTRLAAGELRAHGFKSFLPFDRGITQPKTRRIEHVFKTEESRRIFDAGRIPDNKLTVNHLVLAALCLLPIYDNPPSPDSDGLIFMNFGLVNARQRLDKKYRELLAYPGYCLGVTSLHIPLSILHDHPVNDTKGLLYDFAKAVKKEYTKQAAYPSLLAIQPQVWDSVVHAPPPMPCLGPQYAGDGKGSTYLFPKYASGKAVIEIEHFFVSVNVSDPGPFFRCTEWNGRMILSIDFNEFAVDPTVVQSWMNIWVDLLLNLTK